MKKHQRKAQQVQHSELNKTLMILRAISLNMYLFILICGVILLPQSFSLKCNGCRNLYGTCDEDVQECSVAFTRCGIMRYNIVKSGKSKGTEFTIGACFKEDDCKNGSFNSGVSSERFTTKCCSTNKCNTRQPRPSTLASTPNGLKCYRCNEKGDECTATQVCVGDQVYCATRQYGSLKKGCATKSMCVSPPSALTIETESMTCCEEDYCNGGNVDTSKGIRFSVRSSSSRARASLLLLSTIALMPLFVSV